MKESTFFKRKTLAGYEPPVEQLSDFTLDYIDIAQFKIVENVVYFVKHVRYKVKVYRTWK